MQQSSDNAHKNAYLREKKARKKAEELLEVKSREIFKINRDLENQYSVLYRQKTELELLHQIAVYTQKDISTEETFEYFIKLVCTIFDWPVGHVYIPEDTDNTNLKSSGIWYIDDPQAYEPFKQVTESYQYKADQGLVGKVFSTNKVIWLDNIQDSELCQRKNLCEVDINSAFAIPILTYGSIIAVAEFFHTDQLPIDESLLKIVNTASIQMGIALERRISEKKIMQNYVELQETVEKLQSTQMQLVQSEKMASVGQLAAGVAHEINNPIGFVSSNLRTMTEYTDSFKRMLTFYKNRFTDLLVDNQDLAEEMSTKLDELDIGYIQEDVDQLLTDSLDGMNRVKEIVQGLKNFSRVDSVDIAPVNINECLDTTLKMLNSEIKYKAEVVTEYENIPELSCNAGKLNQVFTNLIVNACQAIDDNGQIKIVTNKIDDDLVVKISDSGKGIPEEHLDNLFDPFFTTKPVGQGTGLGLSISYGIIKEHNGEIDVASIVGQGTTFTVTLPYQTMH